MKDLLLVNRGCCNNLGDQAINKTFVMFLKRYYDVKVHDVDYTSKSAEPDALKKSKTFKAGIKEFVKPLLPLNIIWLVLNYRRINNYFLNLKPDLVVIGGGQLLLPGRFSIASFLWVFLARFHDTKVVFSNVGIGGRLGFIEKMFITYAIKNCNGINARDKCSYERVSQLSKGSTKVILSADIVFASLPHAQKKILTNRVLLSVPSLDVYNTYNEKVSRSKYYRIWIDFLSEHSIDIDNCTLIYTTSEDYFETIQFYSYILKEFNKQLPIEDYEDLHGFELSLNNARVVVSGRMHALILAYNKGCKIITFPISNKLVTFSNQMDFNSADELINSVEAKTREFLDEFLK